MKEDVHGHPHRQAVRRKKWTREQERARERRKDFFLFCLANIFYKTFCTEISFQIAWLGSVRWVDSAAIAHACLVQNSFFFFLLFHSFSFSNYFTEEKPARWSLKNV